MRHIVLLLALLTMHTYVVHPTDRWITIFVHGTINPPEWSLSTCVKLWRDTISDGAHAQVVKAIRSNPFFFLSGPIQELGLHHISIPGNASYTIAQCHHHIYQHFSPSDQDFYTFGWCGLLSEKSRRAAAQKLHNDLSHLITLSHPHTKIRLIGYSHGGNICLYLADSHSINQFFIDQLILMATPVQRSTDHLVHSPMFKNIYHFYSPYDHTQTSDASLKGQLFARRTFRPRKRHPLPRNLKQIRVHLHSIQNELTQEIPISHTTFWHFEWARAKPTQHSPLYPLSLVSISPLLTHAVDKADIPGHMHMHIVPHNNHINIETKQQAQAIPIPLQTIIPPLKNIERQANLQNKFSHKKYRRIRKKEVSKHRPWQATKRSIVSRSQ